jgi:hypothetical protein
MPGMSTKSREVISAAANAPERRREADRAEAEASLRN